VKLVRNLLVAGVVAAALAVPAVAATPTLRGSVGPGFGISITPKTAKAGKVKIVVADKSGIHNFHLTGPGVNKKTSVAGTGTTTWTLTLRRGTYKFVCDPHASSMKGSFKVS
jgi:plastocyanin